ncbi:MAG: hypothetical protein J5U17_06815 [Candidatus Methanoperedens sp.]|nr:hypothetical protein [Candidatus Methanoperedens sp.]MCE8425475.1 hypothetical protein [Candidatus Methanoperedens sp.]MCE8427936.1 hypothetical protein [Candidatus Methanoperedens sp.]
MKIVEIKCEKCGKEIYVIETYLRDKMFCTLGCMDSYADVSIDHSSFH